MKEVFMKIIAKREEIKILNKNVIFAHTSI